MKKIIALALCLVMALAATACGSTSDMVSDETWAELQDLYASLVEARDATFELYNDEAVAADADIEEALTTADEIITKMGELNQEEISEEQVEDLINAISSVDDIFDAAIDKMQPAA